MRSLCKLLFLWFGMVAVAGRSLGQTPPASAPPPAAPPGTEQHETPARTELDAEEPPGEDSTKHDLKPPQTDQHGTLIDMGGGSTSLPDDARGWEVEPGIEDEDVVLAVPRAILFVPQLVLGWTLWPIEQALVLGHEWHVLGYAERLLYFDEAHDFGWHPTASFRSRLGFTVGATVFHDSLFGHRESLEVSAKFLGGYAQSYEVALTGDRIGGGRLWLEARLRYEHEDVSLFGGIGMTDATQAGPNLPPRAVNRRTYFSQKRGLALVRAGYTAGGPGELVQPGVSLIGNMRQFGAAARRTQIGDVYDTSLVEGFDKDVRTLEVQLNLTADFRVHRGLDTRGTYFETFLGRAVGSGYGYYHYAAEVLHTINLYKHTRLLVLRSALEGVVAERDGVPFSDLPRLGGENRLRGYMEGEYRDALSAFAGIEYHYPIHRNIHGQLFVDAGRVADRYANIYRFRDWKLGYGGGFLWGSEDGISVRLDLAYGDDFQVYLSTDLARALEGRSEQL